MIVASAVANLVRNAAMTVKYGRMHEAAVVWTEYALRTGPLVFTEFDGMSVLDKIYVSEVKRRYKVHDISKLISLIEKTDRDLDKRLKLVRRHTKKKVRPIIALFHDHFLDPNQILSRIDVKNADVYPVPITIERLPKKPADEELLTLTRALVIEYLSLPRLICENMPAAISCNSPPYDANIEDLTDAMNDLPPKDFAKRIMESAEDPDRLGRLHVCQALYALALALRVAGRRDSFQEVMDRYKNSIDFLMSNETIRNAVRDLPLFMTQSTSLLLDYLENGEGRVILPKAPESQQREIAVRCIDDAPKELLILLENGDNEEHRSLAEVIFNSFKDVKTLYFYSRSVMTAFMFQANKRNLRIEGKLYRRSEIPKVLPPGIDVVSTDLYLSAKRSRRLMRDIQDAASPNRVIVFHRGIVPPSIMKRRTMGRHSLEVM